MADQDITFDQLLPYLEAQHSALVELRDASLVMLAFGRALRRLDLPEPEAVDEPLRPVFQALQDVMVAMMVSGQACRRVNIPDPADLLDHLDESR